MERYLNAVTATGSATEATSKVLRNTYMLLSLTLLFSGVMAAVSTTVHIGLGVSLACSLISMALLWFVVPRTAHSSTGIGVVFLVTGLLGFGLGPILEHYMAMRNGGQVVGMAVGGTGVIFLAMSAIALVTRKDFSFMGKFLMVGILVAFVASIGALVFQIPALALAVSAMFMVLSSGMILWQTSQIINGGETNYVLATVSLYVSIYNIFVSLLQLLGFASGSDD